jgi:hypothetical protein
MQKRLSPDVLMAFALEAANGIASGDRIGQTLERPPFPTRLAVNWTFGWAAQVVELIWNEHPCVGV